MSTNQVQHGSKFTKIFLGLSGVVLVAGLVYTYGMKNVNGDLLKSDTLSVSLMSQPTVVQGDRTVYDVTVTHEGTKTIDADTIIPIPSGFDLGTPYDNACRFDVKKNALVCSNTYLPGKYTIYYHIPMFANHACGQGVAVQVATVQTNALPGNRPISATSQALKTVVLCK